MFFRCKFDLSGFQSYHYHEHGLYILKVKNNIQEIIDKCKKGDASSFRELVNQYQSYAYALAFRIIPDENLVKDIVQESFIRVWKHIKKYEPKIKFTTWLYRIVVNMTLDHVKAERRRNEIFDDDIDKDLRSSDNSSDPENVLINKDTRSMLKRLVNYLTPKQRIVFILFHLHEQSIDEIATITGYSKGNIKSNLYYARMNLARYVGKFEN